MTILSEKIEAAEIKLKIIQEEIVCLKQRQTISCNICKAIQEIGSIDLQVVEFYISPSGCTSGDYWTEGQSPEYNIVCRCGARNRYNTYDRTDWENPKPVLITRLIADNRRHFKSVKSVRRDNINY